MLAVIHLDYYGIGVLTEDCKDFYAVFWLRFVNCNNYANHYCLNDKDKIVFLDTTKDCIDHISTKYNRSISQTNMLFELCCLNVIMLLKVEDIIRKYHLHYCPGTREEVEYIIKTYNL